MSERRIYLSAAEICERDTTAYVVGSIGRSAYTGILLDDFRNDGTKRNLNLIHLRPKNYLAASSCLQDRHNVSISTRLDKWIRVDEDGTTTRLTYPRKPDTVCVAVSDPQEVFAPQELEVEGHTIRTFSPETLAAISRIMFVSRPKDADSFALLDRTLADREPTPAYFDEFARFTEMMRREYVYRLKAFGRNIYHRAASQEQRERIGIGRRFPSLALDAPGAPGNYPLFEVSDE